MTAPFVHLHVHTQYSMLDGAIRVDDLLKQCQAFGMDAVAMTDHGAMFGALEFYVKARKKGIKPIIGCEFYVAEKSRLQKDQAAGHNFHLVLLAMNETGYRNLMKLASAAQLEGFYYKPRIDYQLVETHNEGLIALSACLHGEIAWHITHDDMDTARARARDLLAIFGDRLYFELQENSMAIQTKANEGLMRLGDELGVKLVATNDCHYLRREESYAHEVLLCIQTSRTMNDPKRFKFSTDELYLKSSEEMIERFRYRPDAIANTLEVAARCNLEIKLGDYYFPVFPLPEDETLESAFENACRSGLADRLADLGEAGRPLDQAAETRYRDRLDMEIGVIQKMGFSGYFLIVADFINWAKDQQIPVGPGRGSGAGSLAAYVMRITDIDPIPNGLIFERFLNIERKSMPDFDVDFCKDRRDEVITYVKQKYGGDTHVAQIVAYGSMKARAVIRDVGRALDVPLHEVDQVAKLIPETLKMTIDKAIDLEPKLREAMQDERLAKLINTAKVLEGLARHKTTHAAGVVISPTPMVDYLPLCKGPNDEVLTQYDMKYTEMTGLIKFDFLGLKTLTVIDRALKLIKGDGGPAIDLGKLPMDDPRTYGLLCKGDSLGVFQLESDGMRDLLIRMKPEQFSDLVALVALYRPGPLDSGMVDTFVETKHGRKPPVYPLPQIKEVLEETYGVIVYQEQVMKIANILASYSLGDADILRRAMGKKIPEVMEKEREKFMAGARANHIDEDKAKNIFDLMAKFAGYGFNKSHSAAYALIAYQTAYLKAHYQAQYMAALLSCDVDNTDKVVKYINECKKNAIEVLPPDVNQSNQDFSVVKDRIRFGLAAIKGLGVAALDAIILERLKKGPYRSLSDLCGRIDSSRVNRKVLESLIKAGAFDSLGGHRAQYMEVLDDVLEQSKAVQRDRASGQLNIFGLAAPSMPLAHAEVALPEVAEWPETKKLGFEKETVGFFITGHPLEKVRDDLLSVVDVEISGLGDRHEGRALRVGGLIQSYKNHKSKKGDPMAFAVLEDLGGSVEVVIFPSTHEHCSHLLDTEEPLVVLGTVQMSERGPKIIAEAVDRLADAMEKYTESAQVLVRADRADQETLNALKELFYGHRGACSILLTLHFDGRGEVDVEVLKDMTIRPGTGLSRRVHDLLGYPALRLTMKPSEIERRGRGGRFGHGQTEH